MTKHDKAVKEFMDAPEVSYHLLPMRESDKGDKEHKEKKEKKKRKNDVRDDKPPKNPKVDIPEGCATRNDSNQNICFGYNRKPCMVRGAKCRRGLHVCWRKGCFEKHPSLTARKGGRSDIRRRRGMKLGMPLKMFHR